MRGGALPRRQVARAGDGLAGKAHEAASLLDERLLLRP
jgi:hypothetical protein